jgi:protease II
MVKIRCYFTHTGSRPLYGCLFFNEVVALDRGFIYAIAHIRGGEDLGRQWYDDGKLLKKSTFTDFIDCSKYVIQYNYTSADHLYAGGSAEDC